MPANFPSDARQTITDLNAVTSGATTFAARVISVLNRFFGSNNPFGTAATADTGTEQGDVPLLGSGGVIPQAQLPAASNTQSGLLRLASSLADTGNVVPTAAQVSAEITRLESVATLNTNSFGIQEMPIRTGSPTEFSLDTTAGGFIIASGGGGGTGATDLTVSYGYSGDNPASGGQQSFAVPKSQPLSGGRLSREVRINNSLAQATGAGTPQFIIALPRKGAISASSGIGDADLVLALIGNAGGKFVVTGGDAGTSGAPGFAFFFQLEA